MGVGNENLPRRVEGCIEGHNEGNIQDCHQDNHVPDLYSDLAYREQGIRNGKEFWGGVGWV